MNRTMKSKYSSTLGLVIGIIVVVNLLAHEYHVRLDLTEDKQYTLSDATREIVSTLEEPVTIKAYFSKNLPPNIARTRDDFRDMLVEYANLSRGQLLYEFIDPNEKENYEQEAIDNGIRPVLINVREKDQVRQQRAFMGATVQLGEKQEAIPYIEPGAAMEYALSMAIKKISIDEKPTVGFVTGHGEASLAEMREAATQLDVLYETREVTLTDSTTIPDEIRTLALIRPTDSIPDPHLQKLDEFLERGGRLFVALNRVEADFRSRFGSARGTGLEDWLETKGVEVVDNFVVDAQCGAVSVPQQLGIFTIHENISFPFIPVIGRFAEHAITSGLEAMMLEFASEVKSTGDSTKTFQPLAFSSELSNTLQAPQFFDLNRQWTENDFPRRHIPVAAAIEGNPIKMVVIGDADFVINGAGQQSRSLQPDNLNFFSNAIDWLSDDTGLISLRTKGAVIRPIREIQESTKTAIKYLNFLLPVILVIGYGVVRAQRNRATRLKRMNENFELQ